MIDFDIHWTILISLFPNVNSSTFIQIPPPPRNIYVPCWKNNLTLAYITITFHLMSLLLYLGPSTFFFKIAF